MNGINREDLKSLMKSTSKTTVSIYMPTHRLGRELQQDPIRFKNLLDEVNDELKARGWSTAEVNKFLDSARSLFGDNRFWQHLSDGLAVLISEDLFRVYRVPIDFEEFVRVSDHFYLKPLMPLLTGDGHYYVLTLSQGKVRLLEGTREALDEIDIEDVPDSLRKALMWDEAQEYLGWQTGTPRGPGARERRAMYYGQGGGEQDDHSDLLRFFQKIDAGIQEYLQDRKAPLVLVGLEHLLPVYHEANGYPHLATDGVDAQPERMSTDEIHEETWKLIRPYFQRAREEAEAQYKTLAGRNDKQASNDIEEIAGAAYFGRVATLFADVDVNEWGKFDPDSNSVERLKPDDPTAWDLLDYAAVHTLLNDGVVFAVHANRMPESGSAAAVLRY